MQQIVHYFKTHPRNFWLLSACLISVGFFALFHSILLPFIASFILAYTLQPLMQYCRTINLSRQLSSLIIVTLFFILFLLLIFGSIPFIIQELSTLANRFPDYAKEIQGFVAPYYDKLKLYLGSYHNTRIESNLGEYMSKLFNWLFTALLNLLTGTMAIANIVSLIILTPLLTFYFLRDWPVLINRIYALIPIYIRPHLVAPLDEINTTLSAYLRGQLLMCTTLAVYYGTCLKILGLEHGIAVGTTAGFLAFIPYVGYCIGLISALGVALIHLEDWHQVIWVLIIFGGGQIIESFILLPYLIGDRIGLHGAWIIFALLAGGLLFGFWGLLFAVPLFAICRILLKIMINAYQRSYIYLGTEKLKSPQVSVRATDPQLM